LAKCSVEFRSRREPIASGWRTPTLMMTEVIDKP
jgi:hypothetical protein